MNMQSKRLNRGDDAVTDDIDLPTSGPSLTPAQLAGLAALERAVDASPVTAFLSTPGLGNSTVLRVLADRHGGEFISVEDVIEGAKLREPDAYDESIAMVIEQAFDRSRLVILDTIGMVFSSKGARGGLGMVSLRNLIDKAHKVGRRLIFGAQPAYRSSFGWQNLAGAQFVDMHAFRVQDYAVILSQHMGEARVSGIDFDLLYRHAAIMNAHQLVMLAGLLADLPAPTTEDAIAMIDRHITESNTRIGEVEALSFDRLPGAEHIAAKLETHVILPLANKELARELDLRPKRGVLLYGPPGTGKTSIGRALAHRMKGKFFLIDGTVVTEPPIAFFGKLDAIVREAKENAPSVLFIDDADVLFGIVHISGLARYLLTLLDGMESETAGKVCLVMTAMDVRKIPSAILRSGRVELWLETRAPTLETRAAILRQWLGEGLPGAADADFAAVAAAAGHFTPADLRRVVGDAKSYYAADTLAGRAPAEAQAYLLQAIEALIATRARMADNLRDESLRIGTVKAEAKYGAGIGGLAEDKYGAGIGGLAEAGTKCAVQGW